MGFPDEGMAIVVVFQLLEVYVNPTQRHPSRTFFSHSASDMHRVIYMYVQRTLLLGAIRRHSAAASTRSAWGLH